MTLKMLVLVTGIKRKLSRGEQLEDVLESYVNLSEVEKQELREILG